MPFVKVPGLQGKVFVPEKKKCCPQKHLCKDCFSCEYCSDDRCHVCRPDMNNKKSNNTAKKK